MKIGIMVGIEVEVWGYGIDTGETRHGFDVYYLFADGDV